MELNPFEIKSEILRIINKYSNLTSLREVFLEDFELLDNSANRNVISKLLFKELINTKSGRELIVKFLLERYVEKEELIQKLWEILKNPLASSEVKIIVLGFLRELETDWKYEDYENALGDDVDIVDEDTRQMLDTAIINPEVQIDFLNQRFYAVVYEFKTGIKCMICKLRFGISENIQSFFAQLGIRL